MTGMQAAVRDRYGSPDVVELREVERPTPVDDQVLVRVARGIGQSGRPRRHRRRGRPSFGCSSACGRRGTIALGLDVAGVVESVGPGVTSASSRATRSSATCSRSGRAPSPSTSAPRNARSQPMPTGHVVRGGGDAPAFGDPRGPGAAAAGRPHDQARRQGPDRRRVGQRRVRSRSRSRSRWVRRSPASAAPGRWTSSARSAPTTCSTTRRSTTRRPASATTGSSTPTRTTRSCGVRRALRPNGVYVTLGGTGRPILAALVAGTGDLGRHRPLDGPAALVEAVRPRTTSPRSTELIAAGKVKPVIDRRYPLSEIVRGAPLGRRRPRTGKVIIAM